MATTVDDRRETVSLIGSDKVEGTAVYGADKRKIGSVQRVMGWATACSRARIRCAQLRTVAKTSGRYDICAFMSTRLRRSSATPSKRREWSPMGPLVRPQC